MPGTSSWFPVPRSSLADVHQPHRLDERWSRFLHWNAFAWLHVRWSRRCHPFGGGKQERCDSCTARVDEYLDRGFHDLLCGLDSSDVQCAGFRLDRINSNWVRRPLVITALTKANSLTLPTRFPFFELCRQAMRSDAAAVVILIIMCVAAFAAVAGCQQVSSSHDTKRCTGTANSSIQTASRLTWSIARDKGFMGSSRLSRIHSKWEVPVWALCANQAVIFIIGCVYLGSTTAFNAFIGTGLILQLVTFAFPAALLLLRKRSARVLPKTRRFRVPGSLGWIANMGTVGFSLLCLVFWDLPATLPAQPSNMSKFRLATDSQHWH